MSGLVALGLVATACGDDRPTLTMPDADEIRSQIETDPRIPNVNFATPLPADARILDAGEIQALPRLDCPPAETLRPVDESPEELVPLIRQRGRLIVGIDQGSNLFSFRDPVSGDLTGFDVDLAHEIARDIFGDPDAIEFRSMTSDDRVSALESHEVDIVVKSMSITCERRESVVFSAPYYQAYQRLLATRDSEISELSDLEGKRVCVAGETASSLGLAEQLDTVTVLSVNTWADCLVALQQNQVDAITTDDAILVGITEQDPYLEISGPQEASEPYGVGIAPSTPGFNTEGLVRQVNSTLERIRGDGTWNRMYTEWLSLLGPSPGMPAPRYADEPEGEEN